MAQRHAQHALCPGCGGRFQAFVDNLLKHLIYHSGGELVKGNAADIGVDIVCNGLFVPVVGGRAQIYPCIAFYPFIKVVQCGTRQVTDRKDGTP